VRRDAMPKSGWIVGAMAAATVVGAAAILSTQAGAAILRTSITLGEFRQAYGIASVKTLVPSKVSGLSYYMVKRDKFGNKIDWDDPNHAAVDLSKSFIAFRIDDSKYDPNDPAKLKARVLEPGKKNPHVKPFNLIVTSGGVTGISHGGVLISPS
jgi:hypothetical protein